MVGRYICIMHITTRGLEQGGADEPGLAVDRRQTREHAACGEGMGGERRVLPLLRPHEERVRARAPACPEVDTCLPLAASEEHGAVRPVARTEKRTAIFPHGRLDGSKRRTCHD